MSKAQDLIALAILAHKEGEFESAAKFFSDAMASDDLDSYVGHISPAFANRSALHGTVPASENTINPTLAEASDKKDSELPIMTSTLRSEASMLDDGDEETELQARTEEDLEGIVDEDMDSNEITSSVQEETKNIGPVTMG